MCNPLQNVRKVIIEREAMSMGRFGFFFIPHQTGSSQNKKIICRKDR